MHARPSWWAGAALAVLLWAVAVAFFVAQGTRWDAAWLDVNVYRDAAAGLLAGDNVYVERYGPAAGGLPFTYPPFALVLFVPLALASEPVATAALFALNVAAVSLVLHWCAAYAFGRGRVPLWAPVATGAVVAVLVEPVRTTIGLGQINLILLVLILGFDAVGQRHNGIGAGIGAAIKVTPALLVVAQLVRGDWRAFGRGVAAFVVCTLVGALVTWEGSRSFFGGLLWESDRPGSLAYVGNQSLRGLAERLVPAAAPLAWIVSVLLVLGVAAVAVRRHRSDPWASLTAAAVAGLLVSPISWNHHWVWFLPAAAVAVKLRDRSVPLLVITAAWGISTLMAYRDAFEFVAALSAYVLIATAWLVALAVTTPASEPTFVDVTPAAD